MNTRTAFIVIVATQQLYTQKTGGGGGGASERAIACELQRTGTRHALGALEREKDTT